MADSLKGYKVAIPAVDGFEQALPIIKYHYATARQLARLKGVTS